MVERGICELTGEGDIKNAWLSIMQEYRGGDKVTIKPNFNNIHHGYKELFTSPQVINSVIKGLLEYVGVPRCGHSSIKTRIETRTLLTNTVKAAKKQAK